MSRKKLCLDRSRDVFSRASTWMLEKGIQTLSPSPDHTPAQTTKLFDENSHSNWNSERGHFTQSRFTNYYGISRVRGFFMACPNQHLRKWVRVSACPHSNLPRIDNCSPEQSVSSYS